MTSSARQNWSVLESTFLEPPLSARLGARLGFGRNADVAKFVDALRCKDYDLGDEGGGRSRGGDHDSANYRWRRSAHSSTIGILWWNHVDTTLAATAAIVGAIAAFFWPIVVGFFLARRVKNKPRRRHPG